MADNFSFTTFIFCLLMLLSCYQARGCILVASSPEILTKVKQVKHSLSLVALLVVNIDAIPMKLNFV